MKSPEQIKKKRPVSECSTEHSSDEEDDDELMADDEESNDADYLEKETATNDEDTVTITYNFTIDSEGKKSVGFFFHNDTENSKSKNFYRKENPDTTVSSMLGFLDDFIGRIRNGNYVVRLSEKLMSFLGTIPQIAFEHPVDGPACERYKIATLLDPRYAYKDSIFEESEWKSIEKLIFEFYEKKSRDVGINMDAVELEEHFTIQFGIYRDKVKLHDLPRWASSLKWWENHKKLLPELEFMAMGYLAYPDGGFINLVCAYTDQIDYDQRKAQKAQNPPKKCGGEYKQPNAVLEFLRQKKESEARGSKLDHLENNKDNCLVPCVVCNYRFPSSAMTKVECGTPESLFMVVGAFHREEITEKDAKKIFLKMKRRHPTFACHLHYLEACDDILDLLGVSSPNDVKTANENAVHNPLTDVVSLISMGSQKIGGAKLFDSVKVYLEKYYKSVEETKSTDMSEVVCSVCKKSVPKKDVSLLPAYKEDSIKKIASYSKCFYCRAHFRPTNFTKRGRMYRDI